MQPGFHHGLLGPGPVIDRRRTVRRSRAELVWLRGLRLRPGLEVALLDLSAGGALVETRSRLRPGGRAVLRLTSASGSWNVSGEVLRSWVAALEPERGVVYRGALVFDEALECPGLGADGPEDALAMPAAGQQLPAARTARSGASGQGPDPLGFRPERPDGTLFET